MDETKEMQPASKKEKDLERIRRFCLMDDAFMTKVFRRKKCTELLLRLIIGRDDLKIRDISTQYDIKNLQGRSARLDILVADKEGKLYNIEIQRNDAGADPRRARYHSALLDASTTEPGDRYENLRETYVIFITENDVLGDGKPIYHIDRTIRESNRDFEDGAHIIYVNSKIQDETALGKLMHDLYCIDPDKMYYKILADEVRYYKEDTKGVSEMCKILEEVHEEGLEQGRMEGRMEGEMKQKKATAFYLQKMGMSIESIAGAVDQKPSVVESWIKESGASAR